MGKQRREYKRLNEMSEKEFSEKLKLEELLKGLNEAYSEAESMEERKLRRKAKRYYTKIVLKERY